MKYIRIDIGQVPLLRPVVSQVRHIGDQLVDAAYDPAGRTNDRFQMNKKAAGVGNPHASDRYPPYNAKLHRR